ncbi:hypothetical protein HELRODRAFT_189875 [Helobdella robusta]|uniref:Centrosomal protein of 78 kDa n=1 Tax=Helobdella robusta TaxID=6412 RepID=T1FRF8_HELRO|nr:hypothetical protein HELRODRAFT_189875 [Helobdella robusta]ESN90496.1 hypothetical protein HELRODRAFT_189875 [Helobdella robusta]
MEIAELALPNKKKAGDNANEDGTYSNAEDYYVDVCRMNGLYPLPYIISQFKNKRLELSVGKLRLEEWAVIMCTVKQCSHLESITIKGMKYNYDELKSSKNSQKKQKMLMLREYVSRLSKAIRDCLCISSYLTNLTLDTLPLSDRDVEAISKGLYVNRSLVYLSLEGSLKDGEQLEVVCKGIVDNMSLKFLNLTSCNIFGKSASVLAWLIRMQSSMRHSEIWKNSLRYRKPQLDGMGGLRRFTLNNNPQISNQDIQLLSSALLDDLWVRAIDLQCCNITDVGAQYILDMLKFNTSLVVIDIRNNSQINKKILESILDQLTINCGGHETEYMWMKLEEFHQSSSRPATSQQVSSANHHPSNKQLMPFVRKNSAIKSPTGARCKSRISVNNSNNVNKNNNMVVQTNANRNNTHSNNQKQYGLPWRTALRAARFRSPTAASTTRSLVGKVQHTTVHARRKISSCKKQDDDVYDVTDEDDEEDGDVDKSITRSRSMDNIKKKQPELPGDVSEWQRSEQNLESVREIERLKLENDRLKARCEELEENRQMMVESEEALDSIEASFKQFNNFLEMLKQIGLGPLISMAELDPTLLNFPAPPSLSASLSPSRLQQPINETSQISYVDHNDNQNKNNNNGRDGVDQTAFNFTIDNAAQDNEGLVEDDSRRFDESLFSHNVYNYGHDSSISLGDQLQNRTLLNSTAAQMKSFLLEQSSLYGQLQSNKLGQDDIDINQPASKFDELYMKALQNNDVLRQSAIPKPNDNSININNNNIVQTQNNATTTTSTNNRNYDIPAKFDKQNTKDLFERYSSNSFQKSDNDALRIDAPHKKTLTEHIDSLFNIPPPIKESSRNVFVPAEQDPAGFDNYKQALRQQQQPQQAQQRSQRHVQQTQSQLRQPLVQQQQQRQQHLPGRDSSSQFSQQSTSQRQTLKFSQMHQPFTHHSNALPSQPSRKQPDRMSTNLDAMQSLSSLSSSSTSSSSSILVSRINKENQEDNPNKRAHENIKETSAASLDADDAAEDDTKIYKEYSFDIEGLDVGQGGDYSLTESLLMQNLNVTNEKNDQNIS